MYACVCVYAYMCVCMRVCVCIYACVYCICSSYIPMSILISIGDAVSNIVASRFLEWQRLQTYAMHINNNTQAWLFEAASTCWKRLICHMSPVLPPTNSLLIHVSIVTLVRPQSNRNVHSILPDPNSYNCNKK